MKTPDFNPSELAHNLLATARRLVQRAPTNAELVQRIIAVAQMVVEAGPVERSFDLESLANRIGAVGELAHSAVTLLQDLQDIRENPAVTSLEDSDMDNVFDALSMLETGFKHCKQAEKLIQSVKSKVAQVP